MTPPPSQSQILGLKMHSSNSMDTFKMKDILKSISKKIYTLIRVFPVVMYGYESWTIMKAEHWRIDASEMWCWRRLLRVPWTAKRSNQSILKETTPECSLEGLMLKLKLQYFGHLIGRADSFEKTDAGKDWRQEEKGMTDDEMVGWYHWLNGHEFEQASGDSEGQGSLALDGWMASPTQWIWVWVNSGYWWWTGRPGVLRFMGSQRARHHWVTELN